MLVLTDIQKVGLGFTAKSAAGNPVEVQSPIWNTSNPEVVRLEIAPDGKTAEAITTGQIGTARVALSVDADLGEGIREITGLLDIEVKASDAVSLELAPGQIDNRV